MKPILFLTFLLSAFGSWAQVLCPPAVIYTYDAAGNRTARILTQCRQDEPNSNQNPNEILLSNQEGFEINLFPNPTQGFMQAQASAGFMELANKQAVILGLKGEVIHSQSITQASFSLDFSSFASGYYVVRITAEGYHKQWKVQKE